MFIPAVRNLVALSAEMESDRNHVIPPPATDSDDLDLPEREIEEPGENTVEFLGADAQFAHVLHSGQAYVAQASAGSDDDAEDFLGLPGLLTPEQTAALLAKRDAELRRAGGTTTLTAAAPPERSTNSAAVWRDTKSLRKDITTLVSQLAVRSGQTHAEVHRVLRREVPGPGSALAGVDTLTRRRDWLLGQLH